MHNQLTIKITFIDKNNICWKTFIVVNRNSGNLIHYKKLNMYCLIKNIVKNHVQTFVDLTNSSNLFETH